MTAEIWVALISSIGALLLAAITAIVTLISKRMDHRASQELKALEAKSRASDPDTTQIVPVNHGDSVTDHLIFLHKQAERERKKSEAREAQCNKRLDSVIQVLIDWGIPVPKPDAYPDPAE